MRTMLPLALAFFVTSSAFGEELKVYAAAGVKAPFLELAADYEAATGHRIISWSRSAAKSTSG